MLTVLDVKNAVCPADKPYARLTDGNGMYLEVRRLKRTGGFSKTWYYKFRLDGVESRSTLGTYPEMSLSKAREQRHEIAKCVRKKIHPRDRVTEVADVKLVTFQEVAEQWVTVRTPHWSESHRTREQRNLNKDLFPAIGNKYIKDVTARDVLGAAKAAEDRGSLDVAHRIVKTASEVFEFAIGSGHIQLNPASSTRKVLTKHTKKHFAAITQPAEFGKLLAAIAGYRGGEIVKTALKLTTIFFQRPSELRKAKWTEFDCEQELWTVPALRMKRSVAGKKNGPDHHVPIPKQAIQLLHHLKRHSRNSEYLFPSIRSRSRPISDGTLRAALQTLGFGSDVQTIHGFRATARTMLEERLKFDSRVIEANLAHVVKETQGTAYNRTDFLDERRKMMQSWADYIDDMRSGSFSDSVMKADQNK